MATLGFQNHVELKISATTTSKQGQLTQYLTIYIIYSDSMLLNTKYTPLGKSYGRFFFTIIIHTYVTHRNKMFRN